MDTRSRAKPLVISLRNLRAWLEGFEPNDEVGTTYSAAQCPVARFMYDAGCDPTYVRQNLVTWYAPNGTRHRRRLSPSVREFVRQVDRYGEHDQLGPRAPVTAWRALAIIDEVESGR